MSNSNTNLQTQTSSVLQNDTVSSCSISNIQEKTQLSRSRCMHSLKEIKSLFKFLSETLQDYGTMPIFKRTFSQDLDLLEQHLTKDILSRTDCKTTLTKLRTTFENAFNSELKALNSSSTTNSTIVETKEVDANTRRSFNSIPHWQNVDSLKVDLVVIQDTCSEKEDSNSETASSKLVKECSLNFETKDVHAIKYKMTKAKERCMAYFRSLHSHFRVLSKDCLKGTPSNMDQTDSWSNLLFQKFIDSKFTLDYDIQMTDTYFVEYTGLEVQHFRDTLLQHLSNVKKSVVERTCHQRQYERRVNKRQMQTQEMQDDSSRLGNDTDADDADIRPIYDEELMAEVQLTVECNIFAIGQQHTEQPEIIVEGRVDQYPETCQVKSHMLDSSPDNQTTEYSKQSLESENILLKETVAQFQKDFSRMEAHCIALELKYQNQSLKSGQHGQILNETSNKAKIEKEIDVLETMNIELEHSVATLRKENETLKQHYKDLYDSIKITRSKTTEQTTSLLANNAELKAQIQEKVFAIAALIQFAF
ncbi:hypothetical protein Tco_0399615 [Tanacetum coccineum]